MNCDQVQTELSSFAAGDLTQDEHSQVEAHLARCVGCQKELNDIEFAAGKIKAASLTEPPPELRATVLSEVYGSVVLPSLAAVGEAPPADLRARSLNRALSAGSTIDFSRTPRWAWLSAAAAVVALTFALVTYSSLERTRDDLIAERARSNQAEGQLGPIGHELQTLALAGREANAEARLIHFRDDNFRISLRIKDFALTPEGKHYELWMTGAEGEVALGTFRVRRSNDFVVNFPVGIDPGSFPNLVITLEPNDGNPSMSTHEVARATLDPEHLYHGKYDS